jgi:hypothetical protein
MIKIVQSIVHLHKFSFLPIKTLGRHAGVAGCSPGKGLGNKDAQNRRGKAVYQSLKQMRAAWTFLCGESPHRRGSPAYERGIEMHTAC